MTYGHTKYYTPEDLEKIRKARWEQAIFAGYYRSKFNKTLKEKARRSKR